jgi:putative transposase
MPMLLPLAMASPLLDIASVIKRCRLSVNNKSAEILYYYFSRKMTYEYADGYKIRDQFATHFLTFTVVGWIDIFTRQCYREIITDSLKFCIEKKGLLLGAYVIMSNHIHVIWTAKNGNLSDVILDFKTYTSKAIINKILMESESRKYWLLHMFKYHANGTNANDYYKVWTNINHPEEIFSEEFLKTKPDYIHDNPVRAGLVNEQSHYLYSSAASYEGKKGIIDVDLLY